MNVYYDIRTVYPGSSPIVLSMVADNDEYFYAEFSDFDKDGVNEWMMKNILTKLAFHEPKKGEAEHYIRYNHRFNGENAYSLEMRGGWYTVRENLIKWLEQFEPARVQFVGDRVYFSAFALHHFFDDGMELPEHCNDYIFDVNQMMACCVTRRKFAGKGVPVSEVMYATHEWDREELYKLVNGDDMNVEEPHLLTEARIVRAIYNVFSRMYFAPTTIIDANPTEHTVQETKSDE